MKNILGKSFVLLLTAVTITFLAPTSLMADKPDTVVKPPHPPKPEKPPKPPHPPLPPQLPITPPGLNIVPIADAGGDQTVKRGETVILDGSGSTDPDGEIIAYKWEEDGVELSTDISFEKSDFSLGTHIITLTVTDNDRAIASDSVSITVRFSVTTPPPEINSPLKTGQFKSYDIDGNVVTDGSIKDDGYYQTGKARSWSRKNDVVIDNATGLEWQDGTYSIQKPWLTQENYDSYNWYDTSGDTAATYCADLTLDSGGWRLPAIQELETLIDHYQADPSVTPGILNYIYLSRYWSSTTYIGAEQYAWYVSFDYGLTNGYDKFSNYYVRCVRGEQLAPSNFSRNDLTDIVTDSTSGLQWQDDSDINTGNWIEAINYCENTLELGGYTDWRLPNKNELLSIVDYTQFNPSIDPIFQNTQHYHSMYYWSSTTYIDDEEYAWIVSFYIGYSDEIYDADKSDDLNYMRCVRGGQ